VIRYAMAGAVLLASGALHAADKAPAPVAIEWDALDTLNALDSELVLPSPTDLTCTDKSQNLHIKAIVSDGKPHLEILCSNP